MSTTPRILIVEYDGRLRRFLRRSLESEGYAVADVPDAVAARRQLSAGGISLVLIDLGIPNLDHRQLTTLARKMNHVPIIVIGEREGLTVRVRALDAAIDHVAKPFSVGELLGRIRAALRVRRAAGRAGTAHRRALPATFSVGALKVDFERRIVFVRNNEIRLTPTEYKLLAVLIRHADRVVTHGELLSEVWGSEAEDQQYLRVYMHHLRSKLEQGSARPRYLVTVPGVGYRLRIDE